MKLVLDMTIRKNFQNESFVKADFLTLIIMDFDIIVSIHVDQGYNLTIFLPGASWVTDF
jgi:hypothetical protein